MLFDTELDAFQVGIPTVAATALISAFLIIVTINLALKVRKNKVTTGVALLIGETGHALEDFHEEGQVRVGAEIWRAVCDSPINKGDKVSVETVDGLVLHVKKSEVIKHD